MNPWHVSDAGTRISVSDDSQVVCYMPGASRLDRDQARLIASLPMLLEAAQVALDLLNHAQLAGKQRRQRAVQLLQAALVEPALQEAMR